MVFNYWYVLFLLCAINVAQPAELAMKVVDRSAGDDKKRVVLDAQAVGKVEGQEVDQIIIIQDPSNATQAIITTHPASGATKTAKPKSTPQERAARYAMRLCLR
jgi:hypothetical protein